MQKVPIRLDILNAMKLAFIAVDRIDDTIDANKMILEAEKIFSCSTAEAKACLNELKRQGFIEIFDDKGIFRDDGEHLTRLAWLKPQQFISPYY